MTKIVSFNIRCCDDFISYTIKKRAPRVRWAIEKYDPDIIGFQEYTPKWEKYMNATTYPEYDMFLKYRDDEIEDEIEGTPILWKKDKYEMVSNGYFWLSDTPDVKSRGWDQLYNCYRMCTYVKLKRIEDGQTFIFANTHFGFGDKYQVKSAELIRNYLSDEIESASFVLVGDFNARMNTKAYKTLSTIFTDVNAVTTRDFGITFHGYDGRSEKETRHIDYCFVNDRVTPGTQQIIRDKVNGMYISDHYGLYVEVKI